MLILSDGKHGLLSELWWMRALHPVRRIYRQQPGSGAFDLPLLDYALAGPTCDSGDVFPPVSAAGRRCRRRLAGKSASAPIRWSWLPASTAMAATGC